jgi:formylglycine-generating enzyme required for sulfatase activity
MGSNNGDDDEKPVHRVTISQPFYLGKYEITQAQWEKVIGKNSSKFQGDPNLPVENVSWHDTQDFIKKLNAKEGGNAYRLPTEAEWEYAARAGTTTAYSFGDDPVLLNQYGWYASNSDNKTHPVGQLKDNPWGLYDMHGNVWEWVEDWYADKYPSEPQTDPKGPKEGSVKVLRGGSFFGSPEDLRSAVRVRDWPGGRFRSSGFRCVRVPPGSNP